MCRNGVSLHQTVLRPILVGEHVWNTDADEPFAGVDAATESAIVAILQELREQGKTLLVVHHDLPTARDYFDSLLLLNMRVVAFGPTKEVFNQDLLQTTYGGRLTILSEVADAVGSKAS